MYMTQQYTVTSDRTCVLVAVGTTDDDSDPLTPGVPCAAGHALDQPGLFGPCDKFQCAAGWADHDANVSTPCVPCPAGSHCPPGHALHPASSVCLNGTIDHDSNSSTACVQCAPGTHAAANSTGLCTACQPPAVDDDGDPATPCVACGSGREVLEVGETGACDHKRCPQGAADLDASAATPCVECTEGATFQNETGATVCHPVLAACPPSYWELRPPTTSSDRVRRAINCNLKEDINK